MGCVTDVVSEAELKKGGEPIMTVTLQNPTIQVSSEQAGHFQTVTGTCKIVGSAGGDTTIPSASEKILERARFEFLHRNPASNMVGVMAQFAESEVNLVAAELRERVRQLEGEVAHQKANWEEMHRDCMRAESELKQTRKICDPTIKQLRNALGAAESRAAELHQELAKCGKENCMGHEVEGCRRWVSEERFNQVAGELAKLKGEK
jgi:hypothetical protein